MNFSKKQIKTLSKKAKSAKSEYQKSLARKRYFDLLVTIPFLPVLVPVFCLVALLIKIDSKGPIFYISKRVGLNGAEFKFYKFRTMSTNAASMKDKLASKNESGGGVTFKMKQDPRITRVGKWLRKFSIDELPQLLNVLLGDMSLVGPRPAIKREVDMYKIDECKRLYFTPGLTCIWQVSGRSNISFDKQVDMDLDYIKNYSMLRDLTILLKTIPAVLKGTGAY